ncbi:hypothetical protein QBC33DRAFT_591853 [Phialemonium atrogriseum]|uniref:Uncharacterized protein n=1 Tax=Phialemonium atrogriseum TaxID=1093897 RepID=A0AAJ0CA36_9PEZI|nr:uncharacterized protein QBC33DRAFT_591853 [Phialemonium atrogriseum]KAK1771487.1 hypothetical protein QBC33DRAFT_591853 [Phialemonium atrogriseum]
MAPTRSDWAATITTTSQQQQQAHRPATPEAYHPATPEAYHGEESSGRRRNGDGGGPARTALLRALNGSAHAASCAVLLAIMGEFLARTRGMVDAGQQVGSLVPLAATTIALLCADVALDVSAVAARSRGCWPAWALVPRLACGVGYLAVFMAYVGLGRVFPDGYTFWGVEEGFCGPFVYLLLWLIGVWNLLHTALHRHELGNGFRTYVTGLRAWSRADPGHSHDTSSAPRRSLNSVWRRLSGSWARRRANDIGEGDIERNIEGNQSRGPRPNSTNTISLVERHDDHKAESLTTTSSGPSTAEVTEIEQGDSSPIQNGEVRL